ncbi:MAG: two-component system, cell cycle response regulator [Solirubrobacteraceae bacterium]|nr:two-component system, cell cycle response regulator [Solirubrobacteraceae bacterium]
MNEREQAELERALAHVARLKQGRRQAEAAAEEAGMERAALVAQLDEMARLREDAARASQAELGKVTKLSRTDALTGLPNRRSLDEELPRELARARRHDNPVCAVMLDLDHFKEFNDTRGHQAGDTLLKEIASAWRNALRDSDFVAYYGFVARYGGEEFVLVLPYCALDQAMAVVGRLRAATPPGRTCSAGVALWNRTESADELLARADLALYHAKRNGRDRAIIAA